MYVHKSKDTHFFALELTDCDGQVPNPDPSVDAARPTSATNTPEGEGPLTNRQRLPGSKWQRQGLRAFSTVKGRMDRELARKAAGGAKEDSQDSPRSTPIPGLSRRRPGEIRNFYRGAGGALHDIQPRFWRSVATPDVCCVRGGEQ
ncbi:hypothetical protein NDU88_002795 [Pleurodeles waltl]|uniref:Uncharacterized protein n=1 Tax=Pleurodeles waltl TaxID=8319 RepID=A0AAV7M993_PLEWA|nr:hypothetical protein NDU88_002795 [Pleurodeles waltl]